MKTLTSGERRALRAKAHHLHPVVSVGQHGLTPAVLHEVDVNLTAHELIKIRVLGDGRDAREAMLAEICAAVDAAPVQHLGKILTLWRPAPELPSPPARSVTRNRDSKRPERRPSSKATAPRPRRRRPPG